MGDTPEPMLRRFYYVALRDAAFDLWGEGGVRTIVSRLPPRERDEALEEQKRDWVSERLIIAWGQAAWEGPARRDRAAINKFLGRHVDYGFGRIRRILLRMAAPARFFEKAPEFWRNDHSHGVLETEVVPGAGSSGGALGTVRLRHHPYTETPQMRLAIAEIFRYTVELMRARNVTEAHALEPDGALAIRIRWE